MSMLTKIQESQDLILGKLFECESKIGSLYAAYGSLYPDQIDFWSHLSQEEQKHAGLLQDVREDLKKGELLRGLDHFSPSDVQKLIDFIQEKITEAEERPPSQKQAISIALSIESSIIDTRFFEFAKSNGSSFQKAAAQLANETQEHIRMVQKARLALK